MMLKEACKAARLTRKAVEYYASRGLVVPAALENGYREFGGSDIEKLKKIGILRRLNLSVEEIARVLEDQSGAYLRKLNARRSIAAQDEQHKNALLGRLAQSGDYAALEAELAAIEQRQAISGRLLDAFPGYLGRYICLHFARFLGEPAASDEQMAAYETITDFLDNLPEAKIPDYLLAYLEENTEAIGASEMQGIMSAARDAAADIDGFLAENRESVETYLAYRSSEEYRASPAFELMTFMKKFNQAEGYYDIFIPAMRRLSPTYDEYCYQLEQANDALLKRFPDALM